MYDRTARQAQKTPSHLRNARKVQGWVCLALAVMLSGCAGVLGSTKLVPKQDDILSMIPKPGATTEGAWAVARNNGVTVKARWLSHPEQVPTRNNFFGRISNYVTPYTHGTSTVRLRIENTTDQYLTVATDEVELDIPNQQEPYRPLPLDYFKRHWPVYAVRNDGMVRDQAIAISHVIRTLFSSRTMRPGEIYEGIVPFHRVPGDIQEAHLVVKKLLLDRSRFDVSLDFQRATGP